MKKLYTLLYECREEDYCVFEISIAQKDFRNDFIEKITEIQNNGFFPGFRKGKVPWDVIEARHNVSDYIFDQCLEEFRNHIQSQYETYNYLFQINRKIADPVLLYVVISKKSASESFVKNLQKKVEEIIQLKKMTETKKNNKDFEKSAL